jgi:hypothetical protein
LKERDEMHNKRRRWRRRRRRRRRRIRIIRRKPAEKKKINGNQTKRYLCTEREAMHSASTTCTPTTFTRWRSASRGQGHIASQHGIPNWKDEVKTKQNKNIYKLNHKIHLKKKQHQKHHISLSLSLSLSLPHTSAMEQRHHMEDCVHTCQ